MRTRNQTITALIDAQDFTDKEVVLNIGYIRDIFNDALGQLKDAAKIAADNKRHRAHIKQLKTRIQKLEYALALMVYQYCTKPDGTVAHDWMSAGEHAFEVLGIENFTTEENIDIMIERLEAEMRGGS